jgi:shikimate dehydrogenase
MYKKLSAMHTLAVLGNPIAHSLSPSIHHQFAKQFAIPLNYQKILVPPNQFISVAEQFLTAGGLGFNVTVPFKVTAFHWLNKHTERACIAGAVNTVFRQADHWFGDNTDGIGFIRDCQKKHIELTDQTIVIMGSGGAAQGIIAALGTQRPAKIIVLCRDKNKTAGLLPLNQITLVSYAEAPNWLPQANVLIDATSDPNLAQAICAQQAIFQKNLVIYDLKYQLTEPTAVVAWAKNQDITAYDGLGMLIEQAAESFYQWFRLRPDTKKIRGQDLTIDFY